MFSLLLLLLACPTAEDSGTPEDSGTSSPDILPEDCLQTYGDKCGCEAQCMTTEQIEAVQDGAMCDLACDLDSAEPGWSCTVEDGACAVAG